MRRTEDTLGRVVLEGAVAGLAGGIALLLAEKIGKRTHLVRGTSDDVLWARRIGRRPRGRPRRREMVVGWAAHLAYSACLGAAYAVIERRFELSPQAESLLMSALAFAAHLPNRKLAPARRRAPRLARAAGARVPDVGAWTTSGALGAIRQLASR